jgi:hypothetical protein
VRERRTHPSWLELRLDAGWFDRLAKVLSSGATRRRVVIRLGATILTGRFGFSGAEAKRKRHGSTSAKTCRRVGAPCEGNQTETCCAGLVCLASDRGSARRCTPCASQGAACAGDKACCGGVCCRDELIDPVGTCCASRDRCCGSHCCTAGQACDQRFLMCVACTAEGETCVNPVPFCVCCAGLQLSCDEAGCRCVPESVTA